MFHRKLAKAALIVGSASYMSRDDSHRKTSLSMFQSRPLLKPKVAFSPTSIPAVPAPVMADVTKPAGKRAPEDKGEYYYGLLEKAVKKPIGSQGDFEYHYLFLTLAEAEKARDTIAPETEIIHLHTLDQYLLVLTEGQQSRLGADHPVFAAIKDNDLGAVMDFVQDCLKKYVQVLEYERDPTQFYHEGDEDQAQRVYWSYQKYKDKLDTKNHKGQTPFDYAVQLGKLDLVDMFLRKKYQHISDWDGALVGRKVEYSELVSWNSYNSAINKAIADKRYDLLPLLSVKQRGGDPLSKDFEMALTSNNERAIYDFILAHRRPAIYPIGERSHDKLKSGHFYCYTFDRNADAKLARQILKTEDLELTLGIEANDFEVNISKEDFYKEESCFRDVDTRRQARSGSFFKYIMPTPDFRQCPLGKSWLDKL